MVLHGLTIEEIRACVETVSRMHYEDNLIFNREPEKYGRGVRFTLRTKKSRAPGSGISWSGRHLPTACWHAHRDVMLAFLEKNPDCKLKSALWSWHGRQEFEDGLETSGMRNAGSALHARMRGRLLRV